ncbi:hypothetical protein DdX_18034 [Ditylenchus destructor]|uniref:Uncharacterized protein n=1 Tax=Ditylenchus destructor TaxID=166010 RepID=A0AAD4QYM8_9BILA|nr:hypothetical protein DdX_18034 [Ditylenchus destructor]
MVCGGDIFLSAIDIPATIFHISMAVFLIYNIFKKSKRFCTGFYVLFATISLFDVIQIGMSTLLLSKELEKQNGVKGFTWVTSFANRACHREHISHLFGERSAVAYCKGNTGTDMMNKATIILPGNPYKRGLSYVVESPYSGEQAQENTMEKYADALDNAVGEQDQAYRQLLRANSTVLVLLLRYNARKNFFNTKERIYNLMLAAREKAETQLQDATDSSEKAQADLESAHRKILYSTIFGYAASLNIAQTKLVLENPEPTFPKNAESEMKRRMLNQMLDSDFQRVSSNAKLTSNALTSKKRLFEVRAKNEKRAKTAMESAKAQLEKAEVALNKVKVQNDSENRIAIFDE